MGDSEDIEQETAADSEVDITDLNPSDQVGRNTMSWYAVRPAVWQRTPPMKRHCRLASALGLLLLLVTIFNLNTASKTLLVSLVHLYMSSLSGNKLVSFAGRMQETFRQRDSDDISLEWALRSRPRKREAATNTIVGIS
jgi:hypothetical protein